MRRQPRPVTRDPRARQLPTVTSHAVPTRECQSDPPSLPRATRCSQPRGQPPRRSSPLDLLLHVRTRTELLALEQFFVRDVAQDTRGVADDQLTRANVADH